MRLSSLYPAALLVAAAILPQTAVAAVTDQPAYQESLGCAATMVVAAAMLGGNEKNPASAEKVEASKKIREFGINWLMRAGTFNSDSGQIGKELTAEAERQTAEFKKASSGEAFDNGFRADFRRCLTRGKELGIN